MFRQFAVQAAILVALAIFGITGIAVHNAPNAQACYNGQYCGNPGYNYAAPDAGRILGPAGNGLVLIVALSGRQIVVPAPPYGMSWNEVAANFEGGNFVGWRPKPCGQGGPCR
jgi:hypothetical protein